VTPFPVTPLFVGRETELARLSSALDRVSVAWLFGVGGVGKTSLALAFARSWPQKVVYCDAGSAPLDALVDDARRELGKRARPEPRDTQARLADLVRRLDASKALWVVDDAHELGDVAAGGLVETLAKELHSGRAIFTSRHRLAVSSRASDRLELGVEGLREEAARGLWTSLDELYGPAAGFEHALRRSAGNPWLLRRAHAGPLGEDPSPGPELDELPPDARSLALTLAIADRPLPMTMLEELLPNGRLRPALAVLATRLVVDVDAGGATRIHDLFREALLGRSSAEERCVAESELVRLLEHSELDEKSKVRALTRHLVALGRFDDLDRALKDHAAGVIRAGATGELLRCMELVPPERRSLELSVERARCIGRHYDLPRAYHELTQLAEGPGPPAPELAYALAEAAYDQCLPRRAEALLEPLLLSPELDPELRVRALVRLSAALTLEGRGEEARARLAEARAQAPTQAVAARLALQEAMTLNAEEDWERAASALGRARSLIEFQTLDEHAVYVPLTFAVILSRAGRIAESDALLEKLDLDVETEDDSARIFILASKSSLLLDRGDRLRSLEIRLEAQRLNEPLGGVHYGLTGALWLSRTLFVLGRRSAAERVRAPALALARQLGCLTLARRLERSSLWDPLEQLENPTRGAPLQKRGEYCRERALAALSAAARGDVVQAEVDLAAAKELALGPGYGLDRAILHLARAARAERAGDTATLAEELAGARREAATDGVDPERLEALEAWMTRLAAAGITASSASKALRVVLDSERHELRTDAGATSLKSRPVLRKLLYCLASRANSVVSKDDLVFAMWATEYDPLRHDTPLWQNVRRLRQLLAPVGLGVEVDELGYRLVVPESLTLERTP